jgi:hypothetical protein
MSPLFVYILLLGASKIRAKFQESSTVSDPSFRNKQCTFVLNTCRSWSRDVQVSGGGGADTNIFLAAGGSGGRAVEMLGSWPSTMAAGTVRALSTVSRCRWRRARRPGLQRKEKQSKAKTRRGQCRAVGASRDGSASWWRVSTMQWNGEWDEQENVLQCCTVPSKVHQLHQATRLGLAALADGLVKRDSVIRRAASASASASHHGPCLHGSLSPQPSAFQLGFDLNLD